MAAKVLDSPDRRHHMTKRFTKLSLDAFDFMTNKKSSAISLRRLFFSAAFCGSFDPCIYARLPYAGMFLTPSLRPVGRVENTSSSRTGTTSIQFVKQLS